MDVFIALKNIHISSTKYTQNNFEEENILRLIHLLHHLLKRILL